MFMTRNQDLWWIEVFISAYQPLKYAWNGGHPSPTPMGFWVELYNPKTAMNEGQVIYNLGIGLTV